MQTITVYVMLISTASIDNNILKYILKLN